MNILYSCHLNIHKYNRAELSFIICVKIYNIFIIIEFFHYFLIICYTKKIVRNLNFIGHI